MVISSLMRLESPLENTDRQWLKNAQKCQDIRNMRQRGKAKNAQEGASLAAASPCAAASEAPAAAEGEPDAVVVGDVEDVIADVSVAEPDKEKQRTSPPA